MWMIIVLGIVIVVLLIIIIIELKENNYRSLNLTVTTEGVSYRLDRIIQNTSDKRI